MSTATRRFLRSPKVVCAEIALLAVLCVLGASLPQQGSGGAVEGYYDFFAGVPFGAAVAGFFGLDHVFRSPGFLVIIMLVATSLLLIVLEQWRRCYRLWRQRLSPAHFQSAPLRFEFERPASPHPQRSGDAAQTRIWTERRLGLAGSPVFHTGLLLVIVAAALRAFFGAEAVVDLVEGEELAPSASAWSAQWLGVWGRPIRLAEPVKLVDVRAKSYESGDLQELKVRVAVPGGQETRETELAVNRDLHVRGGRLFLANEFGPAAMLELRRNGEVASRQAVLLASNNGRVFRGEAGISAARRVFLRAGVNSAGDHPTRVEVRVMKDNGLLFAGDAGVGETITLPGGESLTVRGIPFWARLRGSRDSALWLAYAGFGLVMFGAALIFFVVKLDAQVTVTECGERETVFVAFKPQRFAPVFRERFQEVIHEAGWPEILPADLLGEAQGGKASRAGKERGNERFAGGAPSPIGVLEPQTATLCRVALPLLLAGAALLSAGCGRSSLSEARQLVERYNRTVAEAYRRGDARLADSVAGRQESKKLAGLIGVRLDLGLTLDSELLSLEVKGAERSGDELRVRTEERWRYRDRRIGSGAQVGEESLDRYGMLYVFRRSDKTWLAEEIQFATPPQVGRKQMSWPAGDSAPGEFAGPGHINTEGNR